MNFPTPTHPRAAPPNEARHTFKGVYRRHGHWSPICIYMAVRPWVGRSLKKEKSYGDQESEENEESLEEPQETPSHQSFGHRRLHEFSRPQVVRSAPIP